MDPRNFPDAVATVMLGVAHELDETSIDHELVHGPTLTGRAISFVAAGLAIGSMPWVVLDFATGGPHRRRQPVGWCEMSVADDDTGSSRDVNPLWWDFLRK